MSNELFLALRKKAHENALKYFKNNNQENYDKESIPNTPNIQNIPNTPNTPNILNILNIPTFIDKKRKLETSGKETTETNEMTGTTERSEGEMTEPIPIPEKTNKRRSTRKTTEMSGKETSGNEMTETETTERSGREMKINSKIENYFTHESLDNYEMRIRCEFKTPDFKVFDRAYISDYNLLDFLKKDIYIETDKIIHHAQILYIIAREHGFVPFGFTNEPNKDKKTVYVGKQKGRKKASIFARQ